MSARKKVAGKAGGRAARRADRLVAVPVIVWIPVPPELDGPEALDGAMGFIEDAGLTVDGLRIEHRFIAPEIVEEGGGE
jgi:hypothetical protein